MKELEPSIPVPAQVSTLAISSAIGFAFLVYEFRIWSIAIGIAYLPVMFYLMFGFSLGAVGWVYRQYP